MRTKHALVMVVLAVIGAIAAPSAALANARDGSAPTGSTTTTTITTTAAAPSLSALSLNATDVVGGNPVIGTVVLTSPAAPGGFLVALSSDNTVAATVPASVTVPAGAVSATFVVSTAALTNSQSALIIGVSGGVTRFAIITVRPLSQFSNGSISIIPGGIGSGTVSSQPAGISCTIVAGNGGGSCSAFFPAGTVVRLTAKAAAGSKFQGWRGLPGCGDPSRITVARGTDISCQPGFAPQ